MLVFGFALLAAAGLTTAAHGPHPFAPRAVNATAPFGTNSTSNFTLGRGKGRSSGTRGNRKFMPVLQAPVMKSLRTNATNAHQNQKRWLGTETGSNNFDIQLWDNGEVTYWIQEGPDEEKLKTLEKLIHEGVELWHNSGLPNNFKFTKAGSSNECSSNRDKCLTVTLNDKGNQETTVGRPPVNFLRGFVGPFMEIDIDHLPNGWEPGSVLAHEIGHAWGLHHEHQNPKFWAKKFNPNEAYDGNVFGDANFKCTDLDDYGDKSLDARLDGADVSKLCTDIRVAEKYRFSASNFLPLATGYVLPDEDTPDWDSIMLYSTYQTGRQVLTKPDRGEIKVPAAPSPRDVSGLMQLYNKKGQKPDQNLLVQDSNPNQGKFLKIACSDQGA